MALKGIVIDPGHGGKDPGASGNGIIEKDYDLLISKYMYDRFKSLGVNVSLTRNSDITLSPRDRVAKVKSFYGNAKDVIVISNHLNAGAGDGTEIIYALRNNNTLSKLISNYISETGQNVRKYYQLRLPENTSKDYYFILRDTKDTEAIIVEYGFVDSPKDDVNQIKNNYKKYAEAVIKAVCKYKGITYKEVTNNEQNYYVVKKGDTLWDIAKLYNTNVSTLKSLNNLSTDTIYVNQQLLLPNKIYIVKKGDSLWKISRLYNTTISKLMSINNLKDTTLQIGQKLIIM